MTDIRNELLLLEWESLPTPSSTGGLPYGPGVLFSKKCADSPTGLAFTRALVRAAEIEQAKAQRAASLTENAPGSRRKES